MAFLVETRSAIMTGTPLDTMWLTWPGQVARAKKKKNIETLLSGHKICAKKKRVKFCSEPATSSASPLTASNASNYSSTAKRPEDESYYYCSCAYRCVERCLLSIKMPQPHMRVNSMWVHTDRSLFGTGLRQRPRLSSTLIRSVWREVAGPINSRGKTQNEQKRTNTRCISSGIPVMV